MTVKPIFDNTVSLEANQLLVDARKLCDSPPHPDQYIVMITLGKAKADALTDLCAKMDASARPAVESMLQKAQKKIAMAEKVNQFQREAEENKSIDPRIEKIMGKLTQLSSNPPDDPAAAFVKLGKWGTKLGRFGQVGNTMTLDVLLKAKKTVCELDMEFLKKSPEIVRMGYSILSEKNRPDYTTLQNPERCKRQSSIAAAIFYLNAMLRFPNPRMKSMDHDPYMLNGAMEMAQLISQKQPEWRIPEQDVIEPLAQNYPYLALTAVASPEISYLSASNQQEIQLQLQALIDLKNANDLKSIGAIVGLGHQTLALVFHCAGRISLYNPCGDTQRQFSYEANFGSVELVAKFLKGLTDEFNMLPPITLKPYFYPAAPAQPENSRDAPVAMRGTPLSPSSAAPFSLRYPTPQNLVLPPRSSTPHPSFGVLPLPPPMMPYSTGHGTTPFYLNSTSSAMPMPPSMPGNPITIRSPLPGIIELFTSTPGIPFQDSSAPSPAPTHSLLGFVSLSDSEGEDDDSDVEDKTRAELYPGMSSIKECIQALSQRTEEGFYQSLSHLDKLKEDKWTWQDGSQGKVLDRAYFHLYRIQDKETPEKIDRDDHNWGMTAFQTEALSTPEQKLRAVQRVQVEQLLLSLQTLILHGKHSSENFVQLLDELEQMKLNPSDLPSGQTNAAHALFGKFYQVYTKAREEDPSLADPNDEMFKGDFGRHAFTGDFGVENPEKLKIEALQELAKDLKAAWGI